MHAILVKLGNGWSISERESISGGADPTSCLSWNLEHDDGRQLRIKEAFGTFTLIEGKLRLHNAPMATIRKAVKRACGRDFGELIELLQAQGDAEAEDFRRFGGEE